MALKKETADMQSGKSPGQHTFERCQKCGQIVEKTFQRGICRACLQKSFTDLRSLLNSGHAAADHAGHDG